MIFCCATTLNNFQHMIPNFLTSHLNCCNCMIFSQTPHFRTPPQASSLKISSCRQWKHTMWLDYFFDIRILFEMKSGGCMFRWSSTLLIGSWFRYWLHHSLHKWQDQAMAGIQQTYIVSNLEMAFNSVLQLFIINLACEVPFFHHHSLAL